MALQTTTPLLCVEATAGPHTSDVSFHHWKKKIVTIATVNTCPGKSDQQYLSLPSSIGLK
jgi:hypothetical protein